MASSEIIARLGMDTAHFERGMKKAQGSLKKLQKFAARALGPLAAIGTTAGLISLSKKAINAGSAITDLASETRTGIEELQALTLALPAPMLKARPLPIAKRVMRFPLQLNYH